MVGVLPQAGRRNPMISSSVSNIDELVKTCASIIISILLQYTNGCLFVATFAATANQST